MTWRRPFAAPACRRRGRSGREGRGLPRVGRGRRGAADRSLGAPGTTWMRSPRSNRPASSPATAWLGTTTASANRSAPLAIARCHATPRAVRVSGCVHGTTSWIVATTGRGDRVGLRTPRGASRLIPCTGPPPPGARRQAALPGPGEDATIDREALQAGEAGDVRRQRPQAGARGRRDDPVHLPPGGGGDDELAREFTGVSADPARHGREELVEDHAERVRLDP